MNSASSGHARSIFIRPLNVAARRSLLLGTALGLSLTISLAPGAVRAGDECGADVAGVATCTAAGNPYPTGITYAADAGEDITVVVDDSAGAVTINAGTSYGVRTSSFAGYDSTILVDEYVTVTTTSGGLFADAAGGSNTATVENAGDISAGTRGIFTRSTSGASITNSGDITLTGASNAFTLAIGVQGYTTNGLSTVSNTGAVTATGATNDRVRGVESDSVNGSAYVYNGGAVEVTGVGSSRAIGVASFTNATGSAIVVTTVDGTIDVATANGYAYGIVSQSLGGDAYLEAAGAVTVYSTNSIATGAYVFGRSDGTASTGSIEVTSLNGAAVGVTVQGNTGEGSLTIEGDISVEAGGAGTGARATGGQTAVLDMTGDLTVVAGGTATGLTSSGPLGAYAGLYGDLSVTSNGSSATGIRVNASAGTATAIMTGDGTVLASQSATGVYVTAGDYAYVDLTGDLHVTSVIGTALGVVARGTDGATVSVDGDIYVEGSNAYGIIVRSNGAIDLDATGSIDVDSSSGAGVLLRGYGAAATVDGTVGSVTTNGSGADAIRVYADADVVVESTGALTTYGAAADGVHVRNFGSGSNTVTVDDVTTEGTSSKGVYVAGNADQTVYASGLISTAGNSSDGVYVRSFAAGVVYASVTDVHTSGYEADGVWVFGNTDATAIASGYVHTEGDFATGVYVASYGSGTVTVDVGSVTTEGDFSFGIHADSNGGDIDISFDDVSAYGSTTFAVFARAGDDLAIYGGDVHGSSLGISGVAYGGDALVDVGDVTLDSLSGSGGVVILSQTGYAEVTTGDVDIYSKYDYASGVAVFGYTDATVTTGALSATGWSSAAGLNASTATGLVTVEVNGDVYASSYFSAKGLAIGTNYADNDASAVVTVNADIEVVATGQFGTASAAEMNANSDLSATINGDTEVDAGLYARGFRMLSRYGDIELTVNGDLDVSGSRATGIWMRAVNGDLYLNVDGDLIVSGGDVTGVELSSYTGSVDAYMGSISVTAQNGGAAFWAVAGDDSVIALGGIEVNANFATGAAVNGIQGADIDLTVGESTIDGYWQAFGFTAQSQYGSVSITGAGDVTVTSDQGFAAGVFASAGQQASIDLTGDLVIEGRDSATGATALGDTASIIVEGDLTVTSERSSGVALLAYGDTGLGSISVTGDIYVSAADDATGATASSYSAGAQIYVDGDITVISSGADAFGAVGSATYGLVDIEVTGDISATGDDSVYGVLVSFEPPEEQPTYGYGRVSETSGLDAPPPALQSASVTVGGHIDVRSNYVDAYGVKAESYGALDVTVHSVTAASVYGQAYGLYLESLAGAATVEAGDVEAYGAGTTAAVHILGASATLEAGALTATSDGGDAFGAYVHTTGDQTIDTEGDVEADGSRAYGVYANSGSGDAAIAVGGDIGAYGATRAVAVKVTGAYGTVETGALTAVTDSGPAVGVWLTMTDGVDLDVHGDIHADGGSAVGVLSAPGQGDIDIYVDGDVLAEGTSDVRGLNLVADDIVAHVTGDVSAYGASFAFGASATGDSVDLTVDGDLTSAAGTGLVAGITVNSDGAASVTVGGDLTASVGGAGRAVGAYVRAYSDVTVDIDGATTVSSGDALFSSYGVRALSSEGEVSVTTGDVFFYADTGFAVQIFGRDDASFVSDGSVFSDDHGVYVTSVFGRGSAEVIDVYAAEGSAVSVSGSIGVTLTATGEIQAVNGNGLRAYGASGTTYVSSSDEIYADGFGADGIFAWSIIGRTEVVNTGLITAAGYGGDGIFAHAGEEIEVYNGEGEILTYGDQGQGIEAYSLYGAVMVDAGRIRTYGDAAHGVLAQAGADVTVIAGDVAVYGYGSDSVVAYAYAFSGYGQDARQDGQTEQVFLSHDATVIVDGDVFSADGVGVRVGADELASVVLEDGSIIGDSAAIVMVSGIGGAIENHGLIYADSGLAIEAAGGAVSIDNRASIFGRVSLTGNGDSFDNSGQFEAYGASTFGGGTDSLSNSGVVGFSRFNGSAATTTFSSLETFTNTGRVSGVDAQVGDVLSMTSTTFTGGAGSELALDVQFGGPGSSADRIVIAQATGVTTIMPNAVLAATPGAINLAGILVVDSAFASETGDEFTMESVDTGMVEYRLVFDAAADNWLIVGLPDESAFRILGVPGALQDFWQRSNSAVADRFSEMRDSDESGSARTMGEGMSSGRSDGWEMWMQAHGGDTGFADEQTFVLGGVTFVENQSHSSTWGGLQFGVDNRVGDMVWGLTGGFVQQETRYDVGGESFDIEGWNVGAYASWSRGGFFLNGLAKGDFNSLDANLTGVTDFQTFDARSLGLSGELGFRFGEPGAWFVEPMAALAWTTTDVDRFSTSGATIDFGDADSLLGRAGVRFGATMGSGDVILIPSLGVYAIEEFAGENTMTFTTGATGFSITDTPPGAFGQVRFGMTAMTWYGLEGSVGVDWNFGGEADGGSARLGARWRW